MLAVVLALSSLVTHSAAWASPDWAWPVSPRPAVSRGQVIARVASRGHGPGGDAVHWGVRENGEYVNPLRFVADLRPSVLLPVPEHGGQ